jgi:hypothetical protein
MFALRLPLLCLSLPLLAQAPFTIIGVERKGLPPYEENSRVYRLDGGETRGLKMGDRLSVRRVGEGTFALLRIVELKAEWALGVVDPPTGGAPMKGDLALKAELEPIPSLPSLRNPDLPMPKGPTATSVLAPPQEGLIWFLPQSSELSPAGVAKVMGWVEAWGKSGRWCIQVGEAPGADDRRRKARAQAMLDALHAQGISDVAVEFPSRTAEGPHHPVWVQHRD